MSCSHTIHPARTYFHRKFLTICHVLIQRTPQEKEEVEQELEKLRKAYRNIQRESRRLSTTFDTTSEDDKSRELEDQLRQTQRRLGYVASLLAFLPW